MKKKKVKPLTKAEQRIAKRIRPRLRLEILDELGERPIFDHEMVSQTLDLVEQTRNGKVIDYALYWADLHKRCAADLRAAAMDRTAAWLAHKRIAKEKVELVQKWNKVI